MVNNDLILYWSMQRKSQVYDNNSNDINNDIFFLLGSVLCISKRYNNKETWYDC